MGQEQLQTEVHNGTLVREKVTNAASGARVDGSLGGVPVQHISFLWMSNGHEDSRYSSTSKGMEVGNGPATLQVTISLAQVS